MAKHGRGLGVNDQCWGKERDQRNEQAIWNMRKYMEIPPGKRHLDIWNTVEFHSQTSNLILKWAMNLII